MTAIKERLQAARDEIDTVRIFIDARAISHDTSIRLNAEFADDVLSEFRDDPAVHRALQDQHCLKVLRYIDPADITEALESEHGFDPAIVAWCAAVLWWSYSMEKASQFPADWAAFREHWNNRWRTAQLPDDGQQQLISLGQNVLGLPRRFFRGDRMQAVHITRGSIRITKPKNKRGCTDVG